MSAHEEIVTALRAIEEAEQTVPVPVAKDVPAPRPYTRDDAQTHRHEAPQVDRYTSEAFVEPDPLVDLEPDDLVPSWLLPALAVACACGPVALVLSLLALVLQARP